jgi:regulator of sirC expression with transglutaminase-like and TPR domain
MSFSRSILPGGEKLPTELLVRIRLNKGEGAIDHVSRKTIQEEKFIHFTLHGK